MKILWLTWKDGKNPLAGGAEVVNEQLAKRLVTDGHEVIFVTAGFTSASKEEVKDGYKIIRVGDKWSVYLEAYKYYRRNLVGWADLVIDEVNTIPFFARFYAKEKNILFVHQLCREIWFYQMFFRLNIIGYLAEPIYLWLLNSRKVITVSESTRNDLMRYGFREENIFIISEGIEIEPAHSLDSSMKFEKPTLLALGAIRAMKRTDDIIKAFEIAKNSISDLELIVAGDMSGDYGRKVMKHIRESRFSSSIKCLGRIDKSSKTELLRKAHLLISASVKEGWGLVVTEANSQGTPAVVYDVDGLRDAVKDGATGLVTGRNTPGGLSAQIVRALQDQVLYKKLQEGAWNWSKKITFDEAYRGFKANIM